MDKDKSMEKEFKELLKEDENDVDNIVIESNNKKVNIINNNKLKEKLKKCMNVN